MATLTPSGATGTGTETLTFDLGENTSGSTTNYSFKLREVGSSTISDTLSVSQSSTGVAVTSVEVTPSSITINKSSGFNHTLSAQVYPTNATDQRVEWESDDTDYVIVGSTGKLRGVEVTSEPVAVWATSVADDSKYDSCLVTVVEPGSITPHNANQISSATSIAMSVDIENIDTSTLSISLSSGTTWVTSVGSYNSTTGTVTFGFSTNSGDHRSTTVTITGRDYGGIVRTGSATLSQNSPSEDNIQLIGLTVTGPSTISDHGEENHQYVVTYNPANTSEKGVEWDVVDATTGNSVVGTIVSIDMEGDSFCRISALSAANNSNVLVKATSTERSNISDTCAVTVTYVPVIEELQVSPTTVNLAWDAQSDSSAVVTWSNVATPYIPSAAMGGYTGIITGASLNTTTGVITISCNENSSTTTPGVGTVVVKALGDDPTPLSVTVTYNQATKPDPSTYTNVGVGSLTVSGGAKASFSAQVGFQNSSTSSFAFPGTFSYALYGYESSDTTQGTATLLTSGTETDYSDDGLGVRFTVAANSNVQVPLNRSWTGTLGMNTYFILEISISGYTVIPATYDSTL